MFFERSVLIDAPLEIVWQFHERPDILEILTPPWQPIQIVRREGGLEIGAISEFRIFLGPIPLRWVATHIEYEKYRLFTDRQTEGPFTSWIHRHLFAPENGKTRMTDSITFELPGGWLPQLSSGWWVVKQLEDMFRYRHKVTQRECEANAKHR